MRYAGINKNDISAAPGICVTFFTQGCHKHCEGCHNPDTWDFHGGMEFTDDTIQEILDAIVLNGVQRNFCIMGGEPLDPSNFEELLLLINSVKINYPWIKIYLWTGYCYEDLLIKHDHLLDQILANVDVLIDGPYVQALRDITLPMRGSSNQRIINLR